MRHVHLTFGIALLILGMNAFVRAADAVPLVLAVRATFTTPAAVWVYRPEF